MKAIFTSLLLLVAIMASAVPNFDFLGTIGSHTYYISKGSLTGPKIDSAVLSFRSLTSQGMNAYAVAIDNSSENGSLVNLLMTYHTGKYGGSKSDAGDYADKRNPWIGLTDVAVEGTYKWSNAQTTTYRNWEDSEPNNYSSGEDYVHILIMNSGNGMGNPLGEWNDYEGILPLVIEVNLLTPLAVTVAPTMMLQKTDKGIQLYLSAPGVVERSIDGVNFFTLGRFDKLAFDRAPGVQNYYRLKSEGVYSKVYYIAFPAKVYAVYNILGQLVARTADVSRYLGTTYIIL